MAVDLGSPISVPSDNNVLQNFSDATAGRSLQLYYCAATQDSVGVDFVLTRDGGISLPVKLTTGFDVDFDITINKPTIIAGIATVDFTIESVGASSMVVTFNLIHYDGTTETTVGTVTSVTQDVDTPISYKVQFNVTKQLWGIGHILRFNAVSEGPAGQFLYHDPQTAGEELKVWLPIVNLE